MKTKISIIAVLILLIMGCTGKVSNDAFLAQPPEYYNALLQDGWTSFEAGRYSQAVEEFSLAAEREATMPEVYLGLGWSSYRNNALENGRSYFGSAIAFSFLDTTSGDSIVIESTAGLAGIALAAGEYEDAISYVDEVLTGDPAFAFTHDATVNTDALKRIKAIASYYLGDFATAYQQVLDLDLTVIGVIPVLANGFNNAVATATGTTSFDGIATVKVPVSHKLVLVSSVATQNTTYEIKSVADGGNTFSVFGNPALAAGDSVRADYYYTNDFGKFLSDLVAIIE